MLIIKMIFNSEAFKSADVAIEFTNPMVAYDNYMKTFAAGCQIGIGQYRMDGQTW